MLLYAGISSSIVLNTPSFLDIVKKLIQRSQSAGNTHNAVKCGTPETLRSKVVVSDENIKLISKHVPRHLKPLNDEQFGHYLAGLIDGDGHFSKQLQLIIFFDHMSAALAYYLKKRIGYGSVKKVKNKNAYILVIASFKGIEKVIHFINNKIRNNNKLDQINNNILTHKSFIHLKDTIHFNLNNSADFKNHWLAGFSDADASFQIKILKIRNKTEVRLNYQIDKKHNNLLILIRSFIGGNVGYRKSQSTYYYGSTSFGSAKNVINYFNNFHMLSNKHVNYLKWRKAYLIIQDKGHINENSLYEIIKLKNTMNRSSDTAN